MNYWYVSQSLDGWTNLAMDEWFLDHLQPEDMLLYFYVNQNAVIIGKNQNPWKECNLSQMEQDGVQLVRRITGGGAVYHDEGNLNFSFILGKQAYDVSRQLEIIANAVRACGIECEFSGRNDLLADGKKFSGNAFCARGQLRQHHGTLLLHSDLERLSRYLNPDPRKLKAKGVASVRARVGNLGVTADRMLAEIRKSYEAVCGEVHDLILTEAQLGQVLPYFEKQQSWQWRMGKTPEFDLELSERFDWGGVQLLLTLQGGKVEQAQVYTDAMDPDLAHLVEERLMGCRCTSKDLSAALSGDGPMGDIARFIAEQGL